MSEIGEREAMSSFMSAALLKMQASVNRDVIELELRYTLMHEFNTISMATVKSQIAKRTIWNELKNP